MLSLSSRSDSTRCSSSRCSRTSARSFGSAGSAAASAADAAALPTDPKLRSLVVEQRELEHRVESLRLLKESMDPAKYQSELEKLVTDLALKTREIRSLEGAK
jgi:hypothetical protein